MILSNVRQLLQLASTVLSNSYIGVFFTKTISAGPLKGICVPFLNCYACPSAAFSCPIGTLQHFMAIRAIPYYLLSFIAIVGLTIGRMACGWVCPFGFFQDIMYKIKTPKVKLNYYLKYLKYVILLILVLILPYHSGEMWFSKLCPAGTLFAGIPWALWNPVNPQTGQQVLPDGIGLPFLGALVILIGFVLWFVISKRPFCRAVCPMGAMLALFNKFSMIRIEVSGKCDRCNECQNLCPMDLDVPVEYDSEECIRCLECTKCQHVRITTLFRMNEKVSDQ